MKMVSMKTLRYTILFCALAVVAAGASSCSLFNKGSGCPSNGKNVGAEKLLDGSGPKKQPKFKVHD